MFIDKNVIIDARKLLALFEALSYMFPCIFVQAEFWSGCIFVPMHTIFFLERNMSLSLLIMDKITHENPPQKACKKNYKVISLGLLVLKGLTIYISHDILHDSENL